MQVQVGENILLVGTAHVSKTSVEDVKRAIAEFQPDVVAVELDEVRHKAVTQKREWEETPWTKLLKGNTLYLFLAQTLLASYQRRMGAQEGVEPGAEMVAAIEVGEAAGAEIALADRDISITFKRAWVSMGFREKNRVSWEALKALVGLEKEAEEGEPKSVDELLDHDIITTMMEELGEFAPSIKSVLIDERDLYLATRIREAAAEGKKVVAVVGAGHLTGIQRQLKDPQPVSLGLLEHIPKKRVKWGKVFFTLVPLIILGLFGWLAWEAVHTGEYQKLIDAAVAWVVINGICSATGAFLARGHILSVLTAFVAAPLTSINPAVAAGWFAGGVEAFIRKPQVKDFNGLAELETFRDFYKNKVTRVILVAALANIGSMIGTYVAGFLVLHQVVG